MDASGLGGGFMSASGSGLLDLDNPIRRHPQYQISHPQHNNHLMNMMVGLGNTNNQMTQKGISLNFNKGKAIVPNPTNNSNTSEEEEPSFSEDRNGENLNGAKGKNGSQWQRMKWTDNVVRLLIAVVACVGDDGMLEGVEGLKRKPGMSQKKGKWKTVSKIMISKGCCVSPQQCEDKFNDLNKRYKKLNDILGRGTTCKVVENPVLLDSMPQISAKMKEDVKKILSSKHLFYQEMCAYHNGQRIPNCQDIDLQGISVPLVQCSKDVNGSEEEEADGDSESGGDFSDNGDESNAQEDSGRLTEFGERRMADEVDDGIWSHYAGQNAFSAEVAGIFQDPTKSPREKGEWIKNQMLQLQEQRLGFQAQALKLEKRRLKWQRFCSKKDGELERMRLENERMRLENERMTLQLKQKEMEIDLKRSEASLEPNVLGTERPQGRDQIDLGRIQ
ncbi:Myb/SANT-like DNA-binding domain 4 [Dillenia turbinata]|uniref:Myb/SANT-like DNA-binding domain 4 n=1 Tax=Dillenia turbinata TaxID=194707 RepID=A0AAN8Z5H5_9MAGN